MREEMHMIFQFYYGSSAYYDRSPLVLDVKRLERICRHFERHYVVDSIGFSIKNDFDYKYYEVSFTLEGVGEVTIRQFRKKVLKYLNEFEA